MRSTHPLTITLPHDMAAMVKSKVASGDYATESEVIRDGLRALQARDAAMEDWLKGEVAKSYDEHVADPRLGVAAEEVLMGVREAYRTRVVKRGE